MSQSYKIDGTIHHIGATEAKTEKFSVRELVLSVEDGKYTELAVLQFTGDKTSLLDEYREGEAVSVNFNVRGREWNGRYFSNLAGWKIERSGSGSAPSQQQPSGGGDFDDSIPF